MASMIPLSNLSFVLNLLLYPYCSLPTLFPTLSLSLFLSLFTFFLSYYYWYYILSLFLFPICISNLSYICIPIITGTIQCHYFSSLPVSLTYPTFVFLSIRNNIVML